MRTLRINGTEQAVDVPDDMPLLWVLRDVVGLMGTKFGCAIAQCGACTVHINGQPVRSCVTPMRDVGDRAITTIERMAATATGSALQRAWLALQVPQCGYCQSGQIMSAAALLAVVPKPTDARIDAAMAANICRCCTVDASAPPSSRRPASPPPRPIMLPVPQALEATSGRREH